MQGDCTLKRGHAQDGHTKCGSLTTKPLLDDILFCPDTAIGTAFDSSLQPVVRDPPETLNSLFYLPLICLGMLREKKKKKEEGLRVK